MVGYIVGCMFCMFVLLSIVRQLQREKNSFKERKDKQLVCYMLCQIENRLFSLQLDSYREKSYSFVVDMVGYSYMLY